MTGSGGAFFAAFGSVNAARAAADKVRAMGAQVWVCRPVPGWS
jgi:4-diphosphocytidyl-2C-methyl-D-erythritol kinase